MAHAKTARLFLRLNAAFSLLSGCVLLLATSVVAQLLFKEPALWQLTSRHLLGLGLIIFAVALVILARMPALSPRQVLLITAMDASWVVASGVLLVAASELLNTMGSIAIIVVALFVGVFAWGQFMGAKKMA